MYEWLLSESPQVTGIGNFREWRYGFGARCLQAGAEGPGPGQWIGCGCGRTGLWWVGGKTVPKRVMTNSRRERRQVEEG